MIRKFSLFLIALAVAAAWILTWIPTQKVEAQFAGQSAFQIPISVLATTAIKTFPPCIAVLPTATAPCIPNRNQLGHTITYSWGAPNLSNCTLQFQGSNDNSVWFTLAAANSGAGGNTINGMLYTNGYYTYLRIVESVCNSPLSAVYTGYAVPLPINVMAHYTQRLANIDTPHQATTYGTPFLVLGFQCFNPNNAVAYLQLFKATNTPTLGAGFFYEIGIPIGATFNYPGPPFQIFNQGASLGNGFLYAGAATAAGGNAGVATPLVCDFQTTDAGPFYPMTP